MYRYKCYYFILLLLFFSGNAISQTITVDNTNQSPHSLVQLLLQNSCATNSNINISSFQSVSYFNSNGSSFPISEGILIRNGIASHTAGSYTGNNLDSEVNTISDPLLQELSDQSGQSATITDSAFLEFDFVPSSASISFNFLFASNEYGEWQCGFSDVFGFFLTDLVTGKTTNIAVVPGTNTPVSVRDIRDSQYNVSCNSVNQDFFSTYNVDDPANSTLNMRGHTTVMNASSAVIPNRSYRIRLAIGDYNDSNYDSAVFIEAGSFDTSLDLGDDQMMCTGDEVTIDSGFTNTTDFSYQWSLDGNELLGAINPTFQATTTGTYELVITNLSTNCEISDQIEVVELMVNNPNDLLECDTGQANTFNLTFNDATALGIDALQYSIHYYASLEDANNNTPIETSLTTDYTSNGGETIYLRIQNNNTGNFCSTIYDFDLTIASVEATVPNDVVVCLSDEIVDIPTNVESDILTGLVSANYSVSYFTSQVDAENNSNAIQDPDAFPLPTNEASITVWARVTDVTNSICFDIVEFNIQIIPSPPISTSNNVYVCTDYVLPALENGNYFTASNGGGIQLNAGDVITETTVIYIYNENVQGCTSEESFTVFMADEYTMPTEYCGEFVVPEYPNALFYTAPNGPDGNGTVIPTGTIFTENVTIYFYAEENNNFCTEIQFDIVVHPLPPVENLDDVITCDTYTLPSITNGNYFTEENGGGNQLNAGDQITSSQTLHIFNVDPNTGCTNSSSFDIAIIDTSLFQDLSSCGEYTIPNTTYGGYFTQAMGGGDPIIAGTVITSSTTVFYYAPEVTTSPNCTDNLEINITINPIPPVDSLDNVLQCEDDPYELPPLTHGNYFSEPGGNGTQLNVGDFISSSQTIYIYNETAFCNAESSFQVEIRPFPQIDNFTDVFSCDPYTLPSLIHGRYFTESGGQGTEIEAGTIISTTQSIYIFNEYDDLNGCVSENVFTINILGIDVDEPADVDACDSYTLPSLTVGEYFTESNGRGQQLFPGDVISETQTLYVFAENGNRFQCTDEHEFTVSIYTTPTLPVYPDLESCDTLLLPDLSLDGAVINYYRQPGGVDIINPANYTISETGTQTIYVRAHAEGNENCATETSFEITVYPLLDLQIKGGAICIDAETGVTTTPFLLESGLNPNEFTVQWYFNNELVGTGPNYEATLAGTYQVETIKLQPEDGANCNYAPTQVVVESSTPKFEVEFLTDAFRESSIVQINVVDPGLGTYEFAIDDGPFQSDNIFINIPIGKHTLRVRDLSGICQSVINIDFVALSYPKFFTPNDDGINDLWNIPDLKNNHEAIVKVFDRFGGLVYQFRPSQRGWNGFTVTGKQAPSSDYWFEVHFIFQGQPTKFRANFSLLRK